MTLRILTHVPDIAFSALRLRLPDDELIPVPDDGPLADDMHGELLVTTRLPWANLEATVDRGVRWIQILGTGMNGFPDAVVGDRPFTCCRGATGLPMAEWSMAMILAFAKDLPNVWLTEPPERTHLVPLDGLSGRTIGLLGFGSIGHALAAMAAPFGAHVVAARRTTQSAEVDGVEIIPVDDVIRQADHLVLCLPATAETVRMLGTRRFGTMKRGVHIVNVARGELIDDDALRAALDDGIVARASLDVTEPEPLPAHHWMYSHPGVRLSPHCSWSSHRGVEELVNRVASNVSAWKQGRALDGTLDRSLGY